ncbi:MAG: NCS2 family permease, partial [Candidatus Eisenbacteria bacterium]
MKKFFRFDALGTNYRRETLGGLTTFFAMAYIVIVNPAILAKGGFPHEASIVATIVSAAIGTFLMAVYARRPFATAPYMGENAFIAFTLCLSMGYPWQTALGAVFIGGVIFVIITALKIRSWIATAIPDSLKRSFAVGIGFFIMFVGLNETGIVRLGVAGAPLRIGDLSSAGPLLAILCVAVICVLMIRRVPGSLLIGMLSVTSLAYVLKIAEWPARIVSAPPSLLPTLFKMDVGAALSFDFLPVILVLFILD